MFEIGGGASGRDPTFLIALIDDYGSRYKLVKEGKIRHAHFFGPAPFLCPHPFLGSSVIIVS